MTAPAPARPGTGAVWTPVGARAVAEPSRSPWIVAQPAVGNTQAAACDASWADPFSRFKNQERVPRGKFQTKSCFRKSNLSVTVPSDRMTKKITLLILSSFFSHIENKVHMTIIYLSRRKSDRRKREILGTGQRVNPRAGAGTGTGDGENHRFVVWIC